MHDKRLKVLLIEDDPGYARLIQKLLAKVGGATFVLECAGRLSTGLERLDAGDIDLVLLDLGLPDSQGLDTFFRVHAQAPQIAIVVLASVDDENLAIKAVQEGTQDYLVREQVDGNMLVHSMRYAIERKRAEKALQESEGKYRATFENTGTAMVILEENTTISLANHQFEILSGYSKYEIEGKKRWTEFVHQEDLERMQEYHHQRRKSKGAAPTRYKFRFVDKERNIKNIFLAIDVIPETKKSIASLMDVTENKLQEAYFQQLFDNSPEGIAILDDTDRVVNTNKGFEALFGYRIEEIKGRFINDIIVPEDRIEEAFALSRATILNSEVCRKETVRKCKDGSLVDVSMLGYPIQFGNKIVGVYVIFTDMTEH